MKKIVPFFSSLAKELVVSTTTSSLQEGNQIQHYWRSWQDGQWRKGQKFGQNVQSAPAAFRTGHLEPYTTTSSSCARETRSNTGAVGKMANGARVRASANTFSPHPLDFRIGPLAEKTGIERNGTIAVFVREETHIQHYFLNWEDEEWHTGQKFGQNIQSAPAAFQNRDYRAGQIWNITHYRGHEAIPINLNYDFPSTRRGRLVHVHKTSTSSVVIAVRRMR